VIETGSADRASAAEIGVGKQGLGRWVRLAREATSTGDTGAVLDADERAELERLRRENAELRLDRDSLKGGGRGPTRPSGYAPCSTPTWRLTCGGRRGVKPKTEYYARPYAGKRTGHT